MGKWLALLRSEISQSLLSCTDKADERGGFVSFGSGP